MPQETSDPSDTTTDPAPKATPRMRYRRDWQEAKRRSLGVKPVPIAPCGTPAAYRRHLRNGEPVDDECLRAWRENNRLARERAAKRRKGKGKDTDGSKVA